MTDWRKVESVIADYLRGEGFAVGHGGDMFAETCDFCVLAQAGEPCPGLTKRTFNVTQLARLVADEMDLGPAKVGPTHDG
jgi:hypothetical protein